MTYVLTVLNQYLSQLPSARENIPIEGPDEENNKTVRYGSRRVASGVDLEEDADQDPKRRHHDETGQQRLAPTKTIDCIQGGQRHYCTLPTMSRYQQQYSPYIPKVVFPAFSSI